MTQVVTSGLDVRPPLRSVVIGSILGALLGAVARFTQQISQASGDVFKFAIDHASVEIVQLLGAAIMGTIAAVALSRKSGAQSFITVEDFFGGFVIGVLIGYQGASYFDTIVGHLGAAAPPGAASSPVPPTPQPR
jgi:H+/Cl- antiporter ClcA